MIVTFQKCSICEGRGGFRTNPGAGLKSVWVKCYCNGGRVRVATLDIGNLSVSEAYDMIDKYREDLKDL